MINIEGAQVLLRERYPDLEVVADGVFRAIDRHADREYAIRYFDLNDELTKTSKSIKSYQEKVLSDGYFSSSTPTDLRWNHYLYFVTSAKQAEDGEYKRSKATVEADREYARKQVVLEEDLARVLAHRVTSQHSSSLPPDLASTWTKRLDENGLGFILDDQISVPEVVRRIAVGQNESATSVVSPVALLPSEVAASRHFLKHVAIHGFRPHPTEKNHALGRVNLIVGSNGVGKTSLLEAIEFAYCGRTRRAGVVSVDTSVTAEMEGTAEKLSSTTSAVRLRARHSNWYAKTELKTVTIEQSFGKFNFLDTDAAVNLSVATSSDQIGADVARLVLGAEAEKLGDRVRRVKEKLQDELKDLRRETNANEVLRLAAQGRLQGLKSAPKVSDGLFTQLLTSLAQVGWQSPPAGKGVIDNLRQDLSSAISAAGLLQHSSAEVLHSDDEGLRRFWSDLENAVQRAGELVDRQKSANLEFADHERKLRTSTNQVTALDALLPYAQAGFGDILAQSRTLRQAVSARMSQLATLTFPLQEEDYAPYLAQPVAEAAAQAARQLEELRQKRQQTQSALRSFEATQSNLTVLRERLLSTAKEMIQRAADPDHCPVCQTRFEQGQLFARILDDRTGEPPAELRILWSEVTALDEQLEATGSEVPLLRSLASCVGETAASMSVAEALASVETARVTLENDATQLAAAERSLAALASSGLTADALPSRLAAAGMNTLFPEDQLRVMRESAAQAMSVVQADVEAAQKKLADVQQETEVLATEFSVDVSSSTPELATQVRARLASFEAAMEARQSLLRMIGLGSGTTIEGLSASLAACQDLFVKMVTADAQETADDAGFSKETKTIDDLKERADGYREKITHLVGAEVILEELHRQSSASELASRILAENASEIARTFASIHMPNEFDLNARDGRLRIVRRQTGHEVDLNQMSTGQRAAFALSLFLAMNTRLQSGPPVLLFDDPVAHVDDINVLSFLDHLRDLAIDGQRQIFFATADSKLAGLFRQKFRFLGDSAFREIQLTRA